MGAILNNEPVDGPSNIVLLLCISLVIPKLHLDSDWPWQRLSVVRGDKTCGRRCSVPSRGLATFPALRQRGKKTRIHGDAAPCGIAFVGL